MRVSGIVPLVLLAACSESSGTSNSVDVVAAASRAEADIANYGAARREARASQRTTPPQALASPTNRDETAVPAGGPTKAK